MWFVAELVMKIIVADDPINVVQQNLILISANSSEEAWKRRASLAN
jgi:hypothetical protein